MFFAKRVRSSMSGTAITRSEIQNVSLAWETQKQQQQRQMLRKID